MALLVVRRPPAPLTIAHDKALVSVENQAPSCCSGPFLTNGHRETRRRTLAGAVFLASLITNDRSRARNRIRAPGKRLSAVPQPESSKIIGKNDSTTSSVQTNANIEINSAVFGQDDGDLLRRITRASVIKTMKNVGLWSLTSVAAGYLLYPFLQRASWALLVGTAGPNGLLCDASQNYVGNFLAIMSLLFSILAGNSYSSLYSQNEAIFCALFAEVSEAKALMEQIALVCSGRPFYRSALANIQRYVEHDLRQLDQPPAVLVACKPRDDPLESILYLTSVGVPSAVYETVRSLRQKRGDRLGAVQRKLPPVQIALLYVLGSLNLVTFLLLGTNDDGRLCRGLFALLVGAVMMTMRVIHELWTPIGGAYNVDDVLAVMIRGLEDELKQRLQGRTFSDTRLPPPPPRWSAAPARPT